MNSVSQELPTFYYDLQSLAPLKQAAAQNPEDIETLRQVAEQFESMFMQMVLKSMRAASQGESLFESKQTLFYRDMLDQELSVKLSGNGGLGLADLLVEQLTRSQNPSRPDPFAETRSEPLALPESPLATAGESVRIQAAELRNVSIDREPIATPLPVSDIETAGPEPDPVTAVTTPVAESVASSPTVSPTQDDHPGIWDSPADFVRDLWPYAVSSAKELGVDPRVLVAQSALETGWGMKVSTLPDGKSSFNLFGIKAQGNWQGAQVTVSTLEYEGDRFVRQKAPFRAYGSIGEAMNDYVQFIKGQARYSGALEQASDPEQYSRALQDAGYATDPIYADKILRVMDSAPMRVGLAEVDELSQG